jgi:hypothetical protein
MPAVVVFVVDVTTLCGEEDNNDEKVSYWVTKKQ